MRKSARKSARSSLQKLLDSEQVRYVIGGGLTTAVNFVAFTALLYIAVDYRIANTVAFVAAAVFAYFINEGFVFRAKRVSNGMRMKRGFSFLLLRATSYAFDMALMILLVSVLSVHSLISKIIVNIIIIVLNYMISKFHIFKGGDSH